MGELARAIAFLFALWVPEHQDTIAVRGVDDLPKKWASMVDPMDPMASSVFIDVIFNDIPPFFVTDTCIAESGCRRPKSIHRGDTLYRRGKRKGKQIGETIYNQQVRWGRVAEDCPFYDQPKDDPLWLNNWTTRGNHGLMFGYNRKYIGTCYPMEWFDIPLVSALAAARKAGAICRRIKTKTGKKCTSVQVRIAWAQAKSRKAKRRLTKNWLEGVARHRKKRKSVNWKHPPSMKDYRVRARKHPRKPKRSPQIDEPPAPRLPDEDRGAPSGAPTNPCPTSRGHSGEGGGAAGADRPTRGGRQDGAVGG